MATILLSAAGASLGSAIGGSVLGLSGAVVGRAVGATVGRNIDQKLLGSGSEAVEVGKIDRFHIGGAGYGAPIKQVWGRMRIAGEIIWATRFNENRRSSGGGKGSPRPATETFSYSVSIALALCEGIALRIGRVWADGVEISPNSLTLRFYPGSEDQLPDPKIEAVEGVGFAPSYRGISYVVIEDLALARFGNRVPQFSFEVIRRAKTPEGEEEFDLAGSITAVALIPGSGEYALATTPVHFNLGLGRNRSANVHSIHGGTDFVASLEQLTEELPLCGSVSLIVSWFGSDLRCSTCLVQPKVEQSSNDGVEMPWLVSGVNRQLAGVIPSADGRPIYGGTPTDASVIEAINAIRNSGKEVMFYPFILMDQTEGNGLPDPWSTSENQPVLPWRGRITLDRAPGRAGSTDRTVDAEGEVASFLGEARPEHFSHSTGSVVYRGPQEWGYRRFILHYAHLCALSGGVDAFCIGSELRGLTQVRSSPTTFPMVDAMRDLAVDVKAILGQQTKVSYASDWSEYFGYHVDGDVIFHLDNLWADPNIDFIGIDNYMPLSDWRDGSEHADFDWGSIYNLDYLESNIAGGEGFDWYYDSPEGESAQRRIPIEDESGGEPWIFKFKDLKSWWSNEHYNRVDGVRSFASTDWIPGMKPIVFTEYGCAALDKASNQPNRFLDPKSSESLLPRGSSGRRDDFIQMQYFNAMRRFWSKEGNNPAATLYEGSMLDLSRCHAWAWDARPFPDFPGNVINWNDGLNYSKGHWLNGRSSNQPISSVVREICEEAGIHGELDTADLNGFIRGFTADFSQAPRARLQSLMLAFGFNAREREGAVEFWMPTTRPIVALEPGLFARSSSGRESLTFARSSNYESVERTRLTYIEAEGNYRVKTAEAFSEEVAVPVGQMELQIQLTDMEANGVAERWLAGIRMMREVVQFLLPNSIFDLAPGDVIVLEGLHYLVERVEGTNLFSIDAVRTDPRKFEPAAERGDPLFRLPFIASTPVSAIFLDLPLLQGGEVPHAPHVAISATPWQGEAAVWSSFSDTGFVLNQVVRTPSMIGITQSSLFSAPSGLWDRGSVLRVELGSGGVSSALPSDVLNGANVIAIGDGSPDNWEVLQFSVATLVDRNIYDFSVLLRGLAGTDAVAKLNWPVGSLVVFLDDSLPQINMSIATRGLARNFRVGLLESGYMSLNVIEISQSFTGNGLRPYSVSHLSTTGSLGEDIFVSWIRRTRLDGDNWQSVEVPLGEESESYVVVVSVGNVEVRRIEISVSSWIYTIGMQSWDGVSGSFVIAVAQQSTSFGLGPFNSAVFYGSFSESLT